jgi:elongation factor G
MASGELVPIVEVALVPSDPRDLDRIQAELDRMAKANPALRFTAKKRGEVIILGGEDELQLDAVRKLLALNVSIGASEIRVAYRETICKRAEAEGKYIRQTGGRGNYGHCWLRVEPNGPGKGYEFANEIEGGAAGNKAGVVPKEYVNAIDQGVQGALELGILAGFPIIDVKVTLFDGSYHEVDSNEMAFKFAGSIAFKEVMAVEVTVPEEFMGGIIGDINSRRGRIEGIEPDAGLQVSGTHIIRAMVSLAQLLRSSRYGRPDWPMRFARYEQAPPFDGFNDGLPSFARNPRDPRPRSRSSFVWPED